MVPLLHVVDRIIAVDNDIIREDNFELHIEYLCQLTTIWVRSCIDNMHQMGRITQAFYNAITSARAERERWLAEAAEPEPEQEEPQDHRAHESDDEDRDDEDRDDLFY